MQFDAFTPKHWLLLILTLLFFNIICYGCTWLIYGVRSF